MVIIVHRSLKCYSFSGPYYSILNFMELIEPTFQVDMQIFRTCLLEKRLVPNKHYLYSTYPLHYLAPEQIGFLSFRQARNRWMLT